MGKPVVIQKTPFQSLNCLQANCAQYRVISLNRKESIVCGDSKIHLPWEPQCFREIEPYSSI